MSTSPSPFVRVRKSKQPVIQAPTPPFSRVTEPDESVINLPSGEEVHGGNVSNPLPQEPRASRKQWPIYLWILASLAGGVIAGRLLYSLWEHVALHDRQLASHQASIAELTGTRTAVSDQAGHLKALDARTGAIQAALEEQGRKLSALQREQAGMQEQVGGMNTRWQRQINELYRTKAPVANVPLAKTDAATVVKDPPAAPAPPAADKHNETFSPDLKPTPNAYAQMSSNGLVVWMTPRPGSSKPIPTSVIGYVRGLGMLVHNWEDNKHYFITDSGSWIPDQR